MAFKLSDGIKLIWPFSYIVDFEDYWKCDYNEPESSVQNYDFMMWGLAEPYDYGKDEDWYQKWVHSQEG